MLKIVLHFIKWFSVVLKNEGNACVNPATINSSKNKFMVSFCKKNKKLTEAAAPPAVNYCHLGQ